MRKLKKYESGEGSHYITRRQALRKLQLSLNDFRRLCILKGIYPREPKHRKKAQKGSNDIRILYHTKDIKFLLHEPIVWTLRDYKIFSRRTNRDRAIRDFRSLKRRLDAYPEIKLDHIVKERYPTFIDAIKDLDDCLTLLFLFSTFPSLKFVPREQSAMCRRLTVEFMHAIIAAKALRYVFISIKGYYFQADIKGQKVTWIVPHYYPFQPQSKSEVDFKVMSIFVEFYTIMLGFVNFRLYHSMNVIYPPTFPTLDTLNDNHQNEDTFVSNKVASLNIDLLKIDSSIAEEIDEDFNIDFIASGDNNDSKKIKKIKQEAEEIQRLKRLFVGLKFFLNREVPREPLVFIIRCFGGQVSWDKTTFTGATFDECDETITHHIVDRPKIDKYLSRDYIQPQYIFDCVNKRQLLPTNQYFVGAILPPHLSPFVDPNRDDYIPPEEKELDPKTTNDNSKHDENESIANNLTEIERDIQLESAYKDEQQEATDLNESLSDSDNDDMDVEKKDNTTTEKKRTEKKSKMSVELGKIHKEKISQIKKNEIEEHRLKARMVKPRHRQLFRKLIRDEQSKKKEIWLLEKKRKRIDALARTKKKAKKIAQADRRETNFIVEKLET